MTKHPLDRALALLDEVRKCGMQLDQTDVRILVRKLLGTEAAIRSNIASKGPRLPQVERSDAGCDRTAEGEDRPV